MIIKDLKVVELANVLAGPLTGSFFAELGAEVIKIENKITGGDLTRQWRLPGGEVTAPISAYYASANYNKHVVRADFKNTEDLKIVKQLISESDIVITNSRQESLKKYGLDYTTLSKEQKDLIYAGLTGFGPEDTRPAFDVVLQAETGYLSMTGTPEGPPVKIPVAMIDILAAHHLKQAILIALLEKQQTGNGRMVSVSLYESALAGLVNQASNYLMAGHIAGRMGTQHPNIAPYGDMYLTRDNRRIVLAIGSDEQFERFASLIGLEPGGYKTNAQRLASRDKLNKEIGAEIGKRSCEEWYDILLKADIPFGRVRLVNEVLNDASAQSLILTETTEGYPTHRMKTALGLDG